MCRVLQVHPSGFYKWLVEPESPRAKANKVLTELIVEYWDESGRTYGSPRIHRDLREAGEPCSENRVARLMRDATVKAIRAYKKPRYIASKPSVIARNFLDRQFEVDAPDQAWVTDITYIRTWHGWLYLAVVIDLYSRMVVGWSMKPSMHRDIVLDALMMALKRRNPQGEVLIHSDQGSQFTSDDWSLFASRNGLKISMSRRGNCWDNACAESFFASLKKERVRRKIYQSHEEARADLFDYIEVFYNRKRRHSHLDQLSPFNYEAKFLAG
jgi:putative transposase